MRLSLRVLGLDLLNLHVVTDEPDPQPPPRESDVGLAHARHPRPT